MNKFQEHFAGFGDQYVLIGGAASELVMEDAGATFRATKDLDIVLCLEALKQEFVEAFWEFINAGGYQNQQRSTGDKIFFRFDRPTDTDYPVMLDKKHKYDVFRLFQVLSPEQRLDIPEAIAGDMHRFLDALSQDTNLSLKPYGLDGLGILDVVTTLRRIYQLPGTD